MHTVVNGKYYGNRTYAADMFLVARSKSVFAHAGQDLCCLRVRWKLCMLFAKHECHGTVKPLSVQTMHPNRQNPLIQLVNYKNPCAFRVCMGIFALTRNMFNMCFCCAFYRSQFKHTNNVCPPNGFTFCLWPNGGGRQQLGDVLVYGNARVHSRWLECCNGEDNAVYMPNAGILVWALKSKYGRHIVCCAQYAHEKHEIHDHGRIVVLAGFRRPFRRRLIFLRIFPQPFASFSYHFWPVAIVFGRPYEASPF